MLLALAVMGWHIQRLSGNLDQAQRIIGTLSAGVESRDAVINRLQVETSERQQNELALRQYLGQASLAAATRERNIKRLTDENETLHQWAIAALPDDVIRLHQRPAFTRADDYLRWLSASDQLPVSVQSAEK